MEIQKNANHCFFALIIASTPDILVQRYRFFICRAPHILQKNSEIPPERDFTIIRFNSSKHRSTG